MASGYQWSHLWEFSILFLLDRKTKKPPTAVAATVQMRALPHSSSQRCADTTHSPSHRSSSGTAHSAATPQRHHSFKTRVISTPVIYLYFTIRMQVRESNACASHSKATQQICQSQNLSENYFWVFPLLTSIITFPQSTQKIKDVKTMCKYWTSCSVYQLTRLGLLHCGEAPQALDL